MQATQRSPRTIVARADRGARLVECIGDGVLEAEGASVTCGGVQA